MPSNAPTFFKVLVNRFHAGINPNFFKGLPQDEVKEALARNVASQDTSVALYLPHQLISRTHYSWLLPYIQKLPKSLQGPIIHALPEGQSKGLKKLLNVPDSSQVLSPGIRAFLMGQLFQQWQPEDAVPAEWLPPSNLSDLLSLSKAQLVELIDLLAIYDLAESVRHIVDKTKLKAIYICLTPETQQFLRQCLHKKEKLAAPKLDISKWDGTKTHLATILHHRGMLRFGKTLCGQSRQFLWLITHTLDTGRGTTISQYYQEAQTPGITPILVQQLVNALNFINNKGKT